MRRRHTKTVLGLLVVCLFIGISVVPALSFNLKDRIEDIVNDCYSYEDVMNLNLGYEQMEDYDDYRDKLYDRYYMNSYDELDEYHHEYFEHHRELIEYNVNKPLQRLDNSPSERPDFENGTTWYVDDIPGEGPDNPPEDFIALSDAIHSEGVKDGDTIYVYRGLYNHDTIVVSKSIMIKGEDKNNTIIECEPIEYVYFNSVIYIEADWVTIENFTIMNRVYNEGDVGVSFYSYDTLRNSSIINNRIIDFQFGIYVIYSADCCIKDNFINNNREFGIGIWGSLNIFISENKLENNGVGIVVNNDCSIFENIIDKTNFGIFIDYGKNNSIYDNIIRNSEIGGMYISDSSNNNITNNIVNSNLNGIVIVDSLFNNIYNNQCINNLIDGIQLIFESKENIIQQNNCTENMKGISIRSLANNNTIKNNLCTRNQQGILLRESYLNKIVSNKCIRNSVGIYLYNSQLTSISNNIIDHNCHKGITLRHQSNNNTIQKNQIGPWNYQGIYIEKSNYNYIENNNITENNDDGVGLVETENNKINHNNIIDNTNYGLEGTLCFDDARNNYWGEEPPKRWIFTNEEVADIYTPGGFVAIRPYLREPVDIASKMK